MNDRASGNDSSIRNQVWDELCDIKYGERYLAFYLDRQKSYKRTAKIITLICSGSGIGGLIKDWTSLTAFSLVLIGVIQIISLVENDLLKSEKELEGIMELREKYVNYLLKLLELWAMVAYENQNEAQIAKKFFKIKKMCWVEIERLDNKLDIKHWKKLKKKAQKDSYSYLLNFNYVKEEYS